MLARAAAVLLAAALAGTGLGGQGVQAQAPSGDASSFLYVTNRGAANAVYAVDASTGAIVAKIPVGSGPGGLAATPDGSQVYVANTFANTVSVIDTASNTVIATVPVGSAPLGVAVSPDGRSAYVANSNSTTVSVIDTATNTVSTTLDTGQFGPTAVATSPGCATAYVANSNGTVSLINTATNTLGSTINLSTSGLTAVALSPDCSTVYVTNASGMVFVISTATNTVSATISVGFTPEGVAVSPDGSTVYVTRSGAASVAEINAATNTVSATVGVGGTPIGVAVSPDGSQVYTADNGGHSVSDITTASNGVTTFPGFVSPYDVIVVSPAAPVPLVPLVVSATAADDTPRASGADSYDVVVTNPNQEAAQVSEITVVLPPGFSYTPGSTEGVTGQDPTQSVDPATGRTTLTWTGPFLLPGEGDGEISVNFGVTVSEAAGSYTIDAAASAPGFDVTPADDTAPVTVTALADLSLKQTASVTSAVPGQTFSYTLDASDAGPSDVPDAVITDTLPAGLTFDLATSSQDCTAAGQDVTCAVGALVAGAAPTPQTIEVTVAASATEGYLDNIADISSARVKDPDPLNNDAQSEVLVTGSNVAIEKSADPDEAYAGDNLTWTITVTNPSLEEVSDAIVTDTLPAGLDFVSADPSSECTFDPATATVTCALGPIAASDGKATITLVTSTAPDLVPPGEESVKVTNTATVTLPTRRTETATAEATVEAAVSPVATKTVSPKPLVAGGLATYQVTVTNNGPSTATDLAAVDRLPPGLTFDAAASDPRCAPSTSGMVQCVDPGPVGPGASVTFTLVARVAPTLGNGSDVVNDVFGAASQPGPSPALDEVPSIVVRHVTLTVTKVASQNTVRAGQPFSYTVTVVNQGPSAASDVVITDHPASADLTGGLQPGAAPVDCPVTGISFQCVIAELLPGAQVTLTVPAIIRPGTPGDTLVCNTASASSAEQGPGTAQACVTVVSGVPVTG